MFQGKIPAEKHFVISKWPCTEHNIKIIIVHGLFQNIYFLTTNQRLTISRNGYIRDSDRYNVDNWRICWPQPGLPEAAANVRNIDILYYLL